MEQPLSGRRGQAIRNDERILAAAKEIFIANADAPISAVATRAGVGISALYRRYPSKEDLLRELCAEGLSLYVEVAETALADDGDPWEAFAEFLRRIVAADVHSLTVRLAGTFSPTPEMFADARRSGELNDELIERAKAGGLRDEVTSEDLPLILEMVAAIRPGVFGDDERTADLRQRYLSLCFDGLRNKQGEPLPGVPPTDSELGRRWVRRGAPG